MQPLPHDALRRKVGPARAGRPPIRDTEYVAALFARLLEDNLKPCLRTQIGIEITTAEVRKFSAMAASVQAPALFGVIRTRHDEFGGVLAMEAPLVHRIVETLTGSEDEEAVEETDEEKALRLPTIIDEALCETFATTVIEAFEKSVSGEDDPRNQRALRFSHFESHGASVLQTPDDLDVLCFDIALAFAPGRPPRRFSLCVSLGALDIFLAAQKAQEAARPIVGDESDSDFIWRRVMLQAANTAEFPLIGVLHQMSLPLGDILDMKPGAVLPLEISGDFTVELKLRHAIDAGGGATIAVGRLGAVGGKRAVKIAEPPHRALIANISRYVASPVDGSASDAAA